MYFSFNNEYPVDKLPDRIRLSNKLTRTDSLSFTDEELLDAGWRKVDDPPNYNSSTHRLSWTGTTWNVSPIPEEELQQLKNQKWQEIRNMRDQKIKDIEWRITRNLSEERLGLPATESLVLLDQYIQNLRNITTQPDPFNIQWPQAPIVNNGPEAVVSST